MPYARRDPFTPDTLDGFSDFLKSAAGLVQRIGQGAQRVENVAQEVQAQIPNVNAVLRQPRAAVGGAVTAARVADSGGSFFVEHPILSLAIGAGVLYTVVKVIRR